MSGTSSSFIILTELIVWYHVLPLYRPFTLCVGPSLHLSDQEGGGAHTETGR